MLRKISERILKKRWEKHEDKIILNNTIEESMKKLCRTKKSIKMRLWRLEENFHV